MKVVGKEQKMHDNQ